MQTKQTTLLILGGGPGGYVAGIRAAQAGIPTILVEGQYLGGTCLNVGCIPSKALIHVADEFAAARRFSAGDSVLGIQTDAPRIELSKSLGWKDGVVERLTGGVGGLLRKAGTQVIRGWGTILDGKTVEVQSTEGERVRVQCEHLLLATGSDPVQIPTLPFGGAVVDSAGALSFAEVPKQLVVIGGGYIGLELGMAWRKLGAEVAIVEATDRVLPTYDAELSRPVLESLKRIGITLHLGCTAEGLVDGGAGVRIRSRQADEYVLPADKVLVAAGRRPRTAGYGLESLQLDMSGRAVKIDSQCRTSMRGVWAIGDLTGEPMLAHRAMAQAEVAVDAIAGKRRRFEPLAIPAVCFTDPEVVAVGLSNEDAGSAGIETITAAFPFAANGRAMSVEANVGFVRVVARKSGGQIIGWQAVGQGVAELVTAFAYSIEMGATTEDIGSILHAHPSLGEAMQEAVFRAAKTPLHI